MHDRHYTLVGGTFLLRFVRTGGARSAVRRAVAARARDCFRTNRLCRLMEFVGRLALVLAVLGTAVGQTDKGVYGTESRLDESAVSGISSALRSAATATVALVGKTKLEYDAGTNTWSVVGAQSLQAGMGLCDTDSQAGGTGVPAEAPFKDQITLSSCSGTVVHWDAESKTGTIATAGHCFDADGDTAGCQTADGALSAPPPFGTTSELATAPSDCGFYIVFDFIDSVQESGSLTIPGAKVYDCLQVTMCDVKSGGWSDGSSFQDFALASFTAAGGGTYRNDRCGSNGVWEEDGMCDVPSDCDLGTDLVDCAADGATVDDDADSEAHRAARTVTFPSRTTLQAGAMERVITPPVINADGLSIGDSLTVIGHPSGLPRKYAGGAAVVSTHTCTGGESFCSASEIARMAQGNMNFRSYTANLDTFGGNSGSGAFNDDGEMIGILISGATDYVHQMTDSADANTYCREISRCVAVYDPPAHCRHYATAINVPAACDPGNGGDPEAEACIEACTDPNGEAIVGMELVNCNGEHVVGIASVIAANYCEWIGNSAACPDTDVVPTCADTLAQGITNLHNCSSEEMALDEAPANIMCSGETCTSEECCTRVVLKDAASAGPRACAVALPMIVAAIAPLW